MSPFVGQSQRSFERSTGAAHEERIRRPILAQFELTFYLECIHTPVDFFDRKALCASATPQNTNFICTHMLRMPLSVKSRFRKWDGGASRLLSGI